MGVGGEALARKTRTGGPPRWQVPEIDAAALHLARWVRHALTALKAADPARWVVALEPLVEPLEDGDLAAVGAASRRVRALFGVGESVAEALTLEDALALREAADAALRAIARYEARPTRRGG